MENIINDLIRPVFVEERSEVHIPYEYLKGLSKEECIALADEINTFNVSKLMFNCLYSSNENKYFDFKILDYIKKEKIDFLAFDNYIKQEQLIGFEHVSLLSLHIDGINMIDLSSFVNIKHITMTGFKGKGIILPNNENVSIYFYETGSKTFRYNIYNKSLESISFTGFNKIDLSNVESKIKRMEFYKVKELKFNKELNYIEYLQFENCNFEKIDISAINNMKKLKKVKIIHCKNYEEFNKINQVLDFEIID